MSTSPSARLVIDASAVARGVSAGIVLIIPVVAIVALADLAGTGWAILAFFVILFAYATAGYGAARDHLDAPLAHGMLAGLGTLGTWLLIRAGIAIVRDNGFIGIIELAIHVLFAATLGMAGGIFAAHVPRHHGHQ